METIHAVLNTFYTQQQQQQKKSPKCAKNDQHNMGCMCLSVCMETFFMALMCDNMNEKYAIIGCYRC